MTSTTRRAAPFALIAALGLSLAACGGDAAPASDGASATTSSSTTSTSEPTPTEQVGREGRQLTAKEITAALPTRDEAPTGYVRDPRGDVDADPDYTPTADPESCLALYQQSPEQRAFKDKHRAGSDRVRYTRDDGRRPAPSVVVSILTYDEAYPQAFFDEAGAVLGECTTHVYVGNADASSADWRADAIPTPSVGQQSFGVRIGRPEVDLAWDYLWVRSGHNVIIVAISTTYDLENDDRLASFAKGVLDDLKK